MLHVLQAMWNVTLSLAPWMLLGMTIAGLLHLLLPRDTIHRQLGGRWGVLKAVALGVPLPLDGDRHVAAGKGAEVNGSSESA